VERRLVGFFWLAGLVPYPPKTQGTEQTHKAAQWSAQVDGAGQEKPNASFVRGLFVIIRPLQIYSQTLSAPFLLD
jgi:hypothetical protein